MSGRIDAMRLLAEHHGSRVFAHTVEAPEVPAMPFEGACFPCLVWHHGEPWRREDMLDFARALIRAGCRYAVCVGPRHAGLDWETAFDMAWVEEYLDAPQAAKDANFLMTSQHDGESVDDVAFFFILNTCFDHHYFQDFLLLHIGTGKDVEAIEDAVMRWLRREYPNA